MHPNADLLKRLFTALDQHQPHNMTNCYAVNAHFKDIAFDLDGRPQIQAMWEMVTGVEDLHAVFEILHADDTSGRARVVDTYTYTATGHPVRNEISSSFIFRDGLIVRQEDRCNALSWGIQALGPVQGLLSWLAPWKRREMAMSKLDEFIKQTAGEGANA
ncbi:MAG: nuclear transport factor 2 family protein [Thiohalocapsa sp. PB-PSB1]|jgi:ketosteroid isomerase-like protein|nr:MAG: hypothetical protein N838_10245 [Thiohalocapsa sp. PB-PSB1]QQO56495.1 MAG: nuclear transport factor 2 family protein [Thiohalocapsa sp. PB-PSB1]HCS88647.1 nuclear transport factor 2 family protein [Chromatiaceae bacterium]